MATMWQGLDYYAILGVLPNAEEVVIRAAYRALAQRYHPDKFQGAVGEAERRMREINEAYEVLCDPVRRAKYNESRDRGGANSTYFAENGGDVPPEYDPLETDWSLALGYYSDLTRIERRLGRISWRLAYGFKAYLLEAKLFDSRAEIAERMEQQFLQTYFGSDPSILDFARQLIDSGNKPAARALNNAVRVLGSGVRSSRIIEKIKDQFGLHEPPPPPPAPAPPLTPEEIARKGREDATGAAILLSILVLLTILAILVAFVAK